MQKQQALGPLGPGEKMMEALKGGGWGGKRKGVMKKTTSERPTDSVTVICCILCFLVCLNAVVGQAFLQH